MDGQMSDCKCTFNSPFTWHINTISTASNNCNCFCQIDFHKQRECLYVTIRTGAAWKPSEILLKKSQLFCQARNGKLAIWLQIRVLGASKPKGCFSKVRSVRTVHALRWSHVMTEPFVKRQWSVITNNGQLTFIASSDYDDWIFSTDKRITEVTPGAQDNLFPLQIDKGVSNYQSLSYQHHFWGFRVGEGSANSLGVAGVLSWERRSTLCCIYELILCSLMESVWHHIAAYIWWMTLSLHLPTIFNSIQSMIDWLNTSTSNAVFMIKSTAKGALMKNSWWAMSFLKCFAGPENKGVSFLYGVG